MAHLQRHNRILNIETSIGSENLRNDQKSLSVSLHTELGATLGFSLGDGSEVVSAGDLERAGTGNQALVLETVLDGTETVLQGFVDLSDCVGVGTLSSETYQLGRYSPLMSIVTLLGSLTCSTNVNFSSPSVCS